MQDLLDWDVKTSHQWAAQAPGLRIRGHATLPGNRATMEGEADAFKRLSSWGFKPVVIVEWGASLWTKSGVRPEKGARIPVDLREAYEQANQLGQGYGATGAIFEMDNEPDLGFVQELPEHYTAFLKATYLGLKAGGRERVTEGAVDGERRTSSDENPDKLRQAENAGSPRAPLVIMAGVGLPPGPWLERFAANDGLSYTDGFNYHYYGYAEDFSAVYRQHEAAVAELSAKSMERRVGSDAPPLGLVSWQSKPLPIFMTEVGYGMLGKDTRDTRDGRLRQWRWYRAVREQVTVLQPEAVMAFVLTPYLEYGMTEFGLTVPPAQPDTAKPESGRSARSAEMALRSDGRRPTEAGTPGADEVAKLKAEGWAAGGIEYTVDDFGAKNAEPWMELIGQEISGNEITPALAQWLTAGSGRAEQGAGSRPWTVTTPLPSPVVVDFIAGDGLQPIKRYNGHFVLSPAPAESGKPEPQKPKPEASKPLAPGAPPQAPLRTEEFAMHVRTRNGNLYEVYPRRSAGKDWQHYFEPGDNFMMSFYGRAELPWRFAANAPAALVVVMYPKEFPAVFEFRRVQLLKVGTVDSESGGNREASGTANQQPDAPSRYGRGQVILYNFSDKPVKGRLSLPESVMAERNTPENGNRESGMDEVTLEPMERLVVEVAIRVPARGYERFRADIAFVPEDKTIPPAGFQTDFIPSIGGMKGTVIAQVLKRDRGNGVTARTEDGLNAKLIADRRRVSEEAPMTLQQPTGAGVSGNGPPGSDFTAYAQQGAGVEKTVDGFRVVVSAAPPDKQQRVEVEIAWPDGLEFPADAFLSLEYRLGPL